MDIEKRISAALGNEKVDLLLENGKLVNVFSGEIHDCSVAVHEGIIVGFGHYDAVETVDVKGKFVTPGLIDGHLHLESSMQSIPEFASNVVPVGTTTVVADPHEMANVLGVAGIRYMLDSSANLPLRVFIMFPSCVPATPFETSGAELTHADMFDFVDNDRILGLAEMMNYPGVLFSDPEVLAKIKTFRNKVLDGHAPGLSGKNLAAYVAAGIGSDHECTTVEEAREKLGMGMRIMIREGSAAKNMDALLPLVNEFNSRNCFFVTDDMEPKDILEKGHMNSLVRKAISKGLHPITAFQMATINPAGYFRMKGIGAVAPGYSADLLILDDLEQVRISRVYSKGKLVAENGRLTTPLHGNASHFPSTMHVPWEKIKNFAIPAEGESVKVIGVIPGQIVTKTLVEKTPTSDGQVVADPERDLLKMSVIERHRGTGGYAVALIKGFGLKSGAIACTVAHDSHNIIVVGTNDDDMITAGREAASLGGGMTVVDKGRILAKLPLPIAGLMSNSSASDIKDGLEAVVRAAGQLGCRLENPFATLSFMALTPIPELKLTDKGLFDSLNFKFVPLFGEGA